MRRVLLVMLLALVVMRPSSAWAQTRLPNGVVRYEHARAQSPGFWQYINDKFGWVIKSRPFNKSVAFLVGVGNYKHLSPQLNYVQSDLDELRRFLLAEGGFDIVYVVGNDVASANLVEDYMFNILPRELASDDRLLFYFSGHGADVDGVGYMQFSLATSEYSRSQYLEVTRTEQWSSKLRAKHVLFLIDACNAGLGYVAKASDGDLDEGLISHFSGDGSRNVLTAGFGRQKAFQVEDGNRQGYSVFTRAFIDSIRQTESRGGFLTLSEVMVGIERRVAAFSRSNPSRQMTPRRWPLFRSEDRDKGTFVFINPRVQRPTIPAVIRDYVSVVAKADDVAKSPVTSLSTESGRLVITVDVSASVYLDNRNVGRLEPGTPYVFSVFPGDTIVVATPVMGGVAQQQQVNVPVGQQKALALRFSVEPTQSEEVNPLPSRTLIVGSGSTDPRRVPVPQALKTVKSDREGRFAVKIPAGLYEVRASFPGYMSALLLDVRVGEAAGERLEINMRRIFADGGAVIALDDFRRGAAFALFVEGIVKDERGHPLAEVVVEFASK